MPFSPSPQPLAVLLGTPQEQPHALGSELGSESLVLLPKTQCGQWCVGDSCPKSQPPGPGWQTGGKQVAVVMECQIDCLPVGYQGRNQTAETGRNPGIRCLACGLELSVVTLCMKHEGVRQGGSHWTLWELRVHKLKTGSLSLPV